MPTFSKIRAPLLLRFLTCYPRPFCVRTLSTVEVFHRNLKISALCRGGKIDAARQLFDEMPNRDVVSWNAIISAHWKNGDLAECTRLFNSMPERNVVSWNSMIAGCIENGRPDEAFEYFNTMPKRNIASWNAMLSGFIKYDRLIEAEKMFSEMPQKNVISYTAMVDGFARHGEIAKARELFDRMPKRNMISWAAMVSGYVENGMFEEARRLFDQMPEKNVVVYTAMITGYSKEGKVEDARMVFNGIRTKDIVSWNAMIAGYVQNGHAEEALKLHIQMLELGVKPDHATLIAILTACSTLVLLQHGRLTHAVAIKTRLESNISLCNALMTMYSKCGSICESDLLFQNFESRDLVSWNTIIAAYAQHGRYEKVVALFRDMEASGLAPNGVTFLSILSACGHAGKANDSLNWFNIMISKYGVSPRAEHYACLVDILGRAGQLEKACDYIREMPFEAEGAVWGALLGACQTYPNLELGELAAKKLVLLDSQNSGAYVMLSNIYAASGMWSEVTRMRGLMKEQGVKKQPGYSWTEIADKVHLFLVGDASHPEISKIMSELQRIGLHMKMTDNETNKISELTHWHEYCIP
ncbi:pentatricopeptide repeat-containing protein At3g02330, mitochondrial-like isoform X1 [Typha latifolia]|uniref:pentatricopeptide repeat-containing protein At3g02330, mitochondrial-like isoform X1 n=1 Tax=Typha latifolia TaxID=4733 RepID=UPI003C2EF4DC